MKPIKERLTFRSKDIPGGVLVDAVVEYETVVRVPAKTLLDGVREITSNYWWAVEAALAELAEAEVERLERVDSDVAALRRAEVQP